MSAHHSTSSCSPLKTVLGKIRDRYQAYCTTHKMHTMATHHRGTGCSLDRGMDVLTEEPEHADIDNESTYRSDATVALGGLEAVGHPIELVYSNWDRLTALMREINDLHQVAAGEGQPAETLDHIENELQNLSIALSTTSTHTCWTYQESDAAIPRYLVYHAEAVKSHELITTRHSCFQPTQLYQGRRLVHWHWDGSRPHLWKQS